MSGINCLLIGRFIIGETQSITMSDTERVEMERHSIYECEYCHKDFDKDYETCPSCGHPDIGGLWREQVYSLIKRDKGYEYYDLAAGAELTCTIQRAARLADLKNITIKFKHNERLFEITSNMGLKPIWRELNKQLMEAM